MCLNTSSLSYVKIYQSDINKISTSSNAFGIYDNIHNTDLFVPRGSKTHYSQSYPWAKFRSIDEFGFVVNINNNDGGKITASKTIVLYKDEKFSLTISPNTGYSLESLSINGIDVTKDIVNGEYIVSDTNDDINVVGVFKINKYKLTYTVDGGEYKSSEVEFGATITAEAEPTKEGYTFSGWSEIPEKMPAHDVTVTGTFSINKYKLAYTIDGQEYKSEDVEYGATITPETAPTKEGYTFSGWSDMPTTMPAHDVTITGTFKINKYKLTYTIDGQEYKSEDVEYGATITPEAAPTKEGHTFSGWSWIPSKMPAEDVVVTGTFSVNKYKITYIVGSVEYKSYEVEYGAIITSDSAPTKEGYTFSGWSEIPATMPAHDVTVTGTFTINKYKLTYMVDGVVYKSFEIDYGTAITPEAAPTKEGHTFSGWSWIPSKMPAEDVTVSGAFSINKYKLTYMIDDKVYKEITYEYGAKITPEPKPEGDYATFAWTDLPETMPAHDVVVHATYTTGIGELMVTGQQNVKIFSPNGKQLSKPQKGVNIIRMSDGTIRKVTIR